jgi:hypothetical protein
MCKSLTRPGITRTCLAAVLAAATVLAVRPAIAQGNPPGCNANALSLNIARNPVGLIVSGTVVTYTITLQNFTTDQANNPGCNIILARMVWYLTVQPRMELQLAQQQLCCQAARSYQPTGQSKPSSYNARSL